MSKYEDDEGILITEYGENQCGNCHATLKKGDKYCRYCGTKRGEGAFAPYRNVMECLYGPPPMKRGYTCRTCGHKWKDVAAESDVKFCPKCGNDEIESQLLEEDWFGEAQSDTPIYYTRDGKKVKGNFPDESEDI